MNNERTRLGENPLEALTAPQATGIFRKTDLVSRNEPLEIADQAQDGDRPDTFPESVKQNPDSRFLQSSQALEKVTLRISIELNDWLDDLLKQGKRKHGQKIPKEIWLQAALELMKSAPIEWTEITSIDHLRETLQNLENGIQNMDL
jgi:hypothetical protein